MDANGRAWFSLGDADGAWEGRKIRGRKILEMHGQLGVLGLLFINIHPDGKAVGFSVSLCSAIMQPAHCTLFNWCGLSKLRLRRPRRSHNVSCVWNPPE